MVKSGQEARRRYRSNISVHHRHLRTATTTTRTTDTEQRPGRDRTHPRRRRSHSPDRDRLDPDLTRADRPPPHCTVWRPRFGPAATSPHITTASPGRRPPPPRQLPGLRLRAQPPSNASLLADAPHECAPTPSAFDGWAPPPPPESSGVARARWGRWFG
jgi:hypothetical protein